jgi:hypothetical protein
VGVLEDFSHVTDVTVANPRGAGNLVTHIDMLSFWQICRTLVLAPGTHVVKRPFLEGEFQFQRQANTDKGIPSALALMVPDDEL